MPSLWLYLLLSVAIESHPADPLLEWALKSCKDALVEGRCEQAHEPAQGSPDFLAQLAWHDALHVEVSLRRSREGALLAQRGVTFSPADAPAERYRALGLIVASYVLAAQQRAPTVSAPAAPATSARQLFALDLALLGGPGLDRGHWRGGGTLRALVRPWDALPNLGVLLAGRATYRPGNPRLVWAGLSLGLSYELDLLRALRLAARLEWVGQRLFARARDAASAVVDRGARYRQGGQLGLELAYRASGHVAPFVGLELAALRPRVRVRVAGSEVGEERALEVSLLLGARFGW